LILLTLGLFMLVINGVIVWVTAMVSGGALTVGGLGDAILAGIVISLANMVLEAIFGLNDDD